MRVEQRVWTESTGWQPGAAADLDQAAQLVLVFGSTAAVKDRDLMKEVSEFYPNAQSLGCSTSGEICGTNVRENSVGVTAVCFEHSSFKGAKITLREATSSFDAGSRLARSLAEDGLKHVFVLSDGLAINGSALVSGLTENLPPTVPVTGGLAGDGERFQETLVFLGSDPERESIVALGLYGDRLRTGYGSRGGWDAFGPERLVTKSAGNVLHELDGRPALELYRQYLGEHANGLPAAGLFFPLSLRTREGDRAVVRTLLSINESDRTVTFAGDIPEGAYARLMKANFDRLIDGAVEAARTSYEAGGGCSPDLAICISCVGRKIVLKQRTEEEVEGVRDVLGRDTVIGGFYSYGEIAPFSPDARCELHNQTMTITTLRES